MYTSIINLYFWPVLIGIIAGILVLIYDLSGAFANKREPSPVPIKAEGLSLLQMGTIIYSDSNKNKKTAAAQILQLARKGKIKLTGKIKEGLLGLKISKIKAFIVNSKGLPEEQKLLLEGLRKQPQLKKFFKEECILGQVIKGIEVYLKGKKYVSAANIQIKKRMALSSLIFYIPGAILLFFGIVRTNQVFVGMAVFLLIIGSGRLIKRTTVPVLSNTGFYLKNEIEEILDKKKENLETTIKTDPVEGFNLFLEELPFIILHPDFKRGTFRKYKKELKKVEEIRVPEWLQLEDEDLKRQIKAKDVLEVIDTTLSETVFVITGAGFNGGANDSSTVTGT